MMATLESGRRRHWARRVAGPESCQLAFLLVAALLVPMAGKGAQGVGGVQKGFKAAEFFAPPNEMQMQSLLQAEKVQPYSDRLFLLTGLTLQTYRLAARPGETGEPELVIKAPQCLYDRDTKFASSAGPLRVTTADGKFSIEGEGFALQQTNSTLVISNRVLTLIDPDLLNPPNGKKTPDSRKENAQGIEIRADQFEYSGEGGLGIYRRNVRVTGSNDMSMTSQELSFELPFKERQLKNLRASQDVVLDHAGVHATGQTAIYSAATGLIRLQGQPAWRQDLREGRGDELIVDRTNKIFRAEGNAWVRMPAEGLSISGLLGSSNSVAGSPQKRADQFVEISSAYYEFRTNHASFGDHVVATERVAGQPRSTLSCERMDVSYTGSNQLQTLVAQKDVVIRDATNLLSGGKAVFNGTNGMLDLTENPAWGSGLRSGRGNVIQIDTRTNEMLVRGDAVMRLPASELSGAATLASAAPGKQAPSAGTNEWAEITSREYTLRPGAASFRGGVRANHPRMSWSSGTLEADLPQTGAREQNLTAEDHVTFELVDEKGKKMRGRGDKVVYHYSVTPVTTNDIVQLTGEQAVLESAQGTNRNRLIIFDRANQQIITPGDYRITSGALKGAGTNALVLPNLKLKK